MGIIKTVHLIYEYIRHDEEEKVAEVKRAIDGVDLEIEEGSFTAILGHNGSGKSTLAKHINGLLLPTEGTVWVGEIDTKEEDRIWDVRKTAGMVFQNPDNQIIGNIVEEDVGFGPENIGVPTDEIWKRVDESLKAVGMTAYRKQSPNKLSGGQKQRVAIAGVMAMRPRCIILDEPTAGLDPTERVRFRNLISELSEDRIVILSTHIVSDVEYIANEIWLMKDGQIMQQGNLDQTLASMQEKVYACEVSQADATKMMKKFKVSNMKAESGMVNLRIIASEPPIAGASVVEPTLEDVFLYYFGEKGGEME